MILVELRFKHYSPKDSESGIKEILIAESLDQAVSYINREHMYGWLDDAKADGDEGSCSPDDEWWEENPSRKEEAESLGLKVDEYRSVDGPAYQLTLWWRGTTWQEVEDAYYGVTHYSWDGSREVSESDADVILRLNLAKDIRNWSDE